VWCTKLIDRYEEAKRDDDRLDFTDLLLRVAGYRCWTEGVEKTEPEGEPPRLAAWFHDEAQDVSALSDAVFKRLIQTATTKWVYVSGDPFQAIYLFSGSHPRFLLDFPADKTEIMPHSWRCPRPILELGEEILQNCDDWFDRKITPANHQGEIQDRSVDDLAATVDPREDWLVLARTNRMVSSLARLLDEVGVPHRKPTKATYAARVLAKMQRGEPITAAEWLDVLEFLPVKDRLVRGTKTYWRKKTAEELRTFPQITPEDWPGLGVLDEYVLKIKSGTWVDDVPRAETYLQAVQAWGEDVVHNPRIQLGTIHSAKGGEADNVALLTSLPYPTVRSLSIPELADAEQRVWYVAVTRAKHRLVLFSDPRARFGRKRLS
jgi:DNA helicase-2/ATP-dependent DNA helicase PcrA